MTRSSLDRIAVSLADILAIEDDAAVLESRCAVTGIPLWSGIRMMFVRMILSDLLYKDTPLSAARRAAVPWRRRVTTAARSALHNARRLRTGHSSVCLVSTSERNYVRDGHWFNPLSDYFALAFPGDTLVIEHQFEWVWRAPRHFSRVLFDASLELRNLTEARLRTRRMHVEAATKLIRIASDRAAQCLNWRPGESRAKVLIATLARQMAILPSVYSRYRTLFQRTGATLIVIENGCFGHSAPIVCAARSTGATTAEYQHGAISAGHDAYNLAQALRRDEAYLATLPEYFLGFGSWWNDQINLPVKRIAIGNPHRTAQTAALSSRKRDKTDVLILGDGVETALYLKLARSVVSAARRQGLRAVFRPHPWERHAFEGHHGDSDGLVIDLCPDIYESLHSAHLVVSEISTGLFEAVGLADRVLLWDTDKARLAFPVHPFDSFRDSSSLPDLISQPDRGFVDQTLVESLWAREWQANYRSFVLDHAAAACCDTA